MKEMVAISANIYHVLNNSDELRPQLELILVVSEPTYRHSTTGGVAKERVMSEFRMSIPASGVDEIVTRLQEYQKLAIEEAIEGYNYDQTKQDS